MIPILINRIEQFHVTEPHTSEPRYHMTQPRPEPRPIPYEPRQMYYSTRQYSPVAQTHKKPKPRKEKTKQTASGKSRYNLFVSEEFHKGIYRNMLPAERKKMIAQEWKYHKNRS